MKRAGPLVFSAMSLASLAAFAFIGTGAAAPRAGHLARLADLSVNGSASMSDRSPGGASGKGFSVTLTYEVTNESTLPVLGITARGALYQGIDTVALTGSPLTSFDCPIQGAGAGLSGGALLWLGPGASAVCSATLDLVPGSYTAWLTASGYALRDWPSPNAVGYAEPDSQPTPGSDSSCPAVLFPVNAPCPLRTVSARGAVPLYRPEPVSPPPPATPSPLPSLSPSPGPPAPSPSQSAVAPFLTSPRPGLTTSPAMSPLSLERMPVALPTRPQQSIRLTVLVVIVPAVSAAAAALGRRR